MKLSIGIKELLEAGVHFGHRTRRWNPKMKQFIFDARNGTHIIDLTKTLTCLEAACKFLREEVRKGGRVLFVGTKKQAQQVIKDVATTTGQPYVTERWLGGTLTNMKTVKRSLNRLREIEKMIEDGSINNYVKQEQAVLNRELARLTKNLGGIRDMEKLPAAAFIVDVKREHNAVAEVRKLKIPLVAIVDTNSDPDLVDYPIPGNDDGIRAVRVILSAVAEAITEGKAEFERAHPVAAPAAAPAAPAPESPAPATAVPPVAPPAPVPAPAPAAAPAAPATPTPAPTPAPAPAPETPAAPAAPAAPTPPPMAPSAPAVPAISDPAPAPKPPEPPAPPAPPTPEPPAAPTKE